MVPSQHKFQREKWADVEEDILSLSHAHHQEVVDYENEPLDINTDHYRKLDQHDHIMVFTARKRGKLIGYGVFIISSHPHYRKTIRAMQDSIFIHPKEREGWLGYKFLRFCDDQLRQAGVKYVYQTHGSKKNIGPLLGKLGYEPIELVWMRKLL